MKAYGLKVNGISHPMGIDGGKVILSWLCDGGVKQTAFRVTLDTENERLYDSNKTVSSDMRLMPSIVLPSKTRVNYSVTLWDENDNEGETVSLKFETVIGRDEWVAKWIDPEETRPEYCYRAMDGLPLNRASYLKKEFELSETDGARLYATAHGVYNLYLNGVAIEDYYMAPGISDYEHRLQVQTYDVSRLLKKGKNELVVTLGEGWWRGDVSCGMYRYRWGTDLALLCQLEVGGKVAMISDESWVASQNGPLGENDTMRLESYDARREIDDWHGVKVMDIGYDNLVGISCRVCAHERFSARLITTPNGQKVLDFGQNMAGYVELDLTAKGGELIRLTHGEVLGKDGNFQNDNFQDGSTPLCRQVVEYICREGRNKFHQTKCYYGFRYALVETDLPIDGSEFIAVAVYSDMEQTGYFECGDERVNRLFENVVWSMKSNFLDVPTDCPTREKLGFTGDCQVFAPAALYLMDSYPVIHRWLLETVSCQAENGCILYVTPPKKGHQDAPIDKDGSAGWSSAMTIVPYRIMKAMGSAEYVRKFYPAIKKWVSYNLEKAKDCRPCHEHLPAHIRNYIIDTANNWGEWNEPSRGPSDYAKESEENGHAEVATAFFALDCLFTAEIAHELGEKSDAVYYRDLFEKVKAAYRYMFTDGGSISSDRQCHYVRPIIHELLDEREKQAAADRLATLIKDNGDRIGTGFLTTCHICDVLNDYGHAEAAFDLLLQNGQPSWLYQVEHGATTIWESWYGLDGEGDPQGSYNHYSLGAVTKWMMSHVLGIKVLDGRITLRPYTDRRLGYAKGSFRSPFGEIRSAWRYEGDSIELEFELPANAEAEVILPDGSERHIATGKHSFRVKA